MNGARIKVLFTAMINQYHRREVNVATVMVAS